MLPGLAEIRDASRLIREHLDPTPALRWPRLEERVGTETWIKHEGDLPTGAFKVRGGLVYAAALGAEGGTLVAATRGNHGQSIAFAAARFGHTCRIVVPEGNSETKNRAMRALGAEVLVRGRDFDEAVVHARAMASEDGGELVPSFDEKLVRGVATWALELFEQVPTLDELYVPIGLGSGICGAIAARDALGLPTRIVGVVSETADAYARSFEAGHVVETASADTIADGLAVRVPDPVALEVIRTGAAEIVRVSEDQVRSAMAAIFADTGRVAEGAGAAGLAAILERRDAIDGLRVATVITGSNVDAALFADVLGKAAARGSMEDR